MFWKSGFGVLSLLVVFFLYSCEKSVRTNPPVSKPVKTKKPIPKQLSIALIFFDNAEPNMQQAIATEIKNFYNSSVSIVSPLPLPKNAFYAPRGRYKADSLIHYLAKIKPSKFDKLVGFSNRDISTSKGNAKDWGIFGLGFRPGPSCVVSSFRLKRNTTDKGLIFQRVTKVALHEIGHTLGVPHCSFNDSKCFMQNAGGKLSTVDNVSKYMCVGCKSFIK